MTAHRARRLKAGFFLEFGDEAGLSITTLRWIDGDSGASPNPKQLTRPRDFCNTHRAHGRGPVQLGRRGNCQHTVGRAGRGLKRSRSTFSRTRPTGGRWARCPARAQSSRSKWTWALLPGVPTLAGVGTLTRWKSAARTRRPTRRGDAGNSVCSARVPAADLYILSALTREDEHAVFENVHSKYTVGWARG